MNATTIRPTIHSARGADRPTVLITEEVSGATLAALGSEVAIETCDGTDRHQLLAAIAEVDVVVVRSATRLDAEVFAAARALRVVARVGVGVDNIDVGAATAAGVLVINAPNANTLSAAEHTVALLLAAARNVTAADAALRAGRWQRLAFTGVELAGKTVGIIGLGRVGSAVAQRLAAFDMEVVAHDPFLPPDVISRVPVRLTDLTELLSISDFITVHLPLTVDTRGLIDETALRLVRPSAILVNVARGGVVDEAALARALAEGRVAGAALDVFEREPCTDSPLFGFPSVVVTPHLGASTAEAQKKAGVSVARSIRAALAGAPVPEAINGAALGWPTAPIRVAG